MKRNHGFSLVEGLIVLAVALIFVMAACNFGSRLMCKHGHEELTGDMVCYGTEGSMRCSPEKEFVCDDP